MKRFWKEAALLETSGGWQVALDGRAVKTQGGRAQIVPSRALAMAMAAEWNMQGETLDPRSFPMRDLTDFTIDRVATGEDDLVTKTLAFAETDTLCYRAEAGTALSRRQDVEWEPLLAAFEAREGVQLTRVDSILHVEQPAETIAALRTRLEGLDPFTLAGVYTLASLSASLCLGLTALEKDADAGALWQTSHLEETVQHELWGVDMEAKAAQEEKRAAFLTAFEFLSLLDENGRSGEPEAIRA
ncbi:ATP12 family chaperone protein [Qipengyuania sp. DSG2-2]|uniref:ATP12 family chaperone protein n=1 Tax=Qipengyuania sp. DGS2-2 TaxID=3349631 RepID=UPI0036D3C239